MPAPITTISPLITVLQDARRAIQDLFLSEENNRLRQYAPGAQTVRYPRLLNLKKSQKTKGVSMRSLALSFLLLCSSLVFAQMQQNRTANQTSDQGSQKIQGCVSGSAGSYTLTDSSGQTFQLAGDTSKLSDNVGKKVEITGTTSSSGSSTGANPSSNPSANPSYPSSGTNPSNPSPSSSGAAGGMGGPTLSVTSVQQIAGSCPSAR
jgi:hypothetical protein